MSYEDFCRYFTSIDVCHMMNTSVFSIKKTWREGKVKATWRRPDRCGGCGNHSSFLNNPQVGTCQQCQALQSRINKNIVHSSFLKSPQVLVPSVNPCNAIKLERGSYISSVFPLIFYSGDIVPLKFNFGGHL